MCFSYIVLHHHPFEEKSYNPEIHEEPSLHPNQNSLGEQLLRSQQVRNSYLSTRKAFSDIDCFSFFSFPLVRQKLNLLLRLMFPQQILMLTMEEFLILQPSQNPEHFKDRHLAGHLFLLFTLEGTVYHSN